MSDIWESIIIVLIGLLYWSVCILSIIGLLYMYIKMIPKLGMILQVIEQTYKHPVVIIIFIIVKIGRFLIMPAIIWGMAYYVLYAQLAIK